VSDPRGAAQRASIVDLLDRVVYRGAAVTGEVVVPLPWVDLIRLDLRLLVPTIDGEQGRPYRRGGSPTGTDGFGATVSGSVRR
jgi:hypothetical protein